MWKYIKIIFILLCINAWAQAQSQDDIAFASALAQPIKKPGVYTQFKDQIQHNSNEVEYVVSSLFFIYKEFFSSQDANRCAFYPSCSVYSIISLKKEGLVKGGIMTFDRLTRCNGLSPEKYIMDVKRKNLLDPINW